MARPDEGARARAELERHVVATQRSIRSCSGCGLCCTEAYNAVHVLPIEGERIARWLRAAPAKLRDALAARVGRALDQQPRLRTSKAGERYTCPFLEPDFRCALPLDVKPIACLAFNPITPDRCDQEPGRYHAAHAPLAEENRALGLERRLRSIPAAVARALRIGPQRDRRRSQQW